MNSPLADVGATRDALERHGLWTKHRLGQNFLVSDAVIGRILGLAEPRPDDVVLEVGPGIGTLTVALLGSGAAVVAVEADRTLAPVLAETCGDGEGRLDIVWGDAVRAVPDRVLECASPNKFVANLPYQVAATLILQAFQTLPSLERAVVMVQREVADRICASPGTKAYGAYTAKLALWGGVSGRFEVGHGCFFPPPRVESAVVRIDRHRTVRPPDLLGAGDAPSSSGGTLSDDDLMQVADVIDAAFAQRRKTIRNSMSAAGYDKDLLDEALGRAGISPTCRAETLAPEDFVRLWGVTEGRLPQRA